jgi:hypothetical protein
MRRTAVTEVTYGQLNRALRALGVTSRLVPGNPPAVCYEHKAFGRLFTFPPFPETDFVVDYHLAGARLMLDNFGIATPKVFDAQLQKAGRDTDPQPA